MSNLTLQSFLLAVVFGLYFVIMAIVFLSRADYYKKLLAASKAPSAGTTMTTSLGLLVTLFFLTMHNFWGFNPRTGVTILCWLSVIYFVLWLAIPEAMHQRMKKIGSGKGYYVACTVMIFLGILVIMRSFYLVMEITGATPLGRVLAS